MKVSEEDWTMGTEKRLASILIEKISLLLMDLYERVGQSSGTIVSKDQKKEIRISVVDIEEEK